LAVYALELSRDFARIYMEWLPAGSVASVLKNAGQLPEAAVRKYLCGILSALAYVHANGIVHRDIKPGNMLVASDGLVKLSDFGTATLSTTYEDSLREGRPSPTASAASRIVGTVPYMSPDVISGVVDPSNDMWALALSVEEMITGVVPWSNTGLSGVQLMYLIGKGSATPVVLSPAMSPRLRDMMMRCLHADRTLRPSALELLKDDYFCGIRDGETGRD
jgi:mitogen-activated protein kinase kinase kinase